MNALVSVIIPFYNNENCINECLQSVINQTYRNIEILLINDGSQDCSYDVCKKESYRDNRIKIFTQENGGVSKARNLGISNAKGEYICFVDADDVIRNDYVEKMLSFGDKADIVICGFIKSKDCEKEYLLNERGFLTKEQVYYNTMCSNIIALYCVNKMYKTSIIRDNKIKFNEKIAVGEDMVFLTSYYRHCKRFFYLDEPLYIYIINKTSVMQNIYSSRKFNDKALTVLEAIDEIIKITRYEERIVKKYISYRAVRSSIWLLLQMIFGNKSNRQVFEKISKNCRKNYWRFLVTNAGTRLEKIVGFALCFSPKIVHKLGVRIIKKDPLFFSYYVD